MKFDDVRYQSVGDFVTHWNGLYTDCLIITGSVEGLSSQDKMATISQTTFSNAFSWMKISEFRLKFHQSLFLKAQLKWYSSIGSDNGLAPNRRQAIIWTNDSPIHGRIYAAWKGNEF